MAPETVPFQLCRFLRIDRTQYSNDNNIFSFFFFSNLVTLKHRRGGGGGLAGCRGRGNESIKMATENVLFQPGGFIFLPAESNKSRNEKNDAQQ